MNTSRIGGLKFLVGSCFRNFGSLIGSFLLSDTESRPALLYLYVDNQRKNTIFVKLEFMPTFKSRFEGAVGRRVEEMIFCYKMMIFR